MGPTNIFVLNSMAQILVLIGNIAIRFKVELIRFMKEGSLQLMKCSMHFSRNESVQDVSSKSQVQ